MMGRRRKRTKPFQTNDDDPLAGMANLFDAAMVFAVALMTAIAVRFQIVDLLTNDDVTLIKNPGQENMEVIVKKGREIERYKANGESGSGKGKRIGTAYELEDGKIVYVPE